MQKGETAAMLLSSSSSYQTSDVGSSRQPSGSLFTIFLTAPLQAFCLLLGISGADIDTVSITLTLSLFFSEKYKLFSFPRAFMEGNCFRIHITRLRSCFPVY